PPRLAALPAKVHREPAVNHARAWRRRRARALEKVLKIVPTPVPVTEALEAAGSRRKPSAPAVGAEGATVALSATSSALAQPDGDIDMARVEAIRNAIRAGELQIDASRIADGLI